MDTAQDRTDRVLVVDGANVVGSRPDGWWRDRPGAAGLLTMVCTADRALSDRARALGAGIE
ncbi:MAG: hypothetical protein WBL35_01990, partial [Ornithinibacter sp.]